MTDDEIIRSVSDDLPVGIWVARVPSGAFVYANKMFAEIMGMGARDDVKAGEYAAPYGICDRQGNPYPESEMPFVRAVRAREVVVVDDIVIHRTDGRHVNIRAQARPVFEAASGELSHVVIAFIDITREVQAESSRQESETRLHRAQRLESIGNLAGGIAHDFNNLLATVRITASTLRLRERDPEKAEALEVIEQVTESAVQLTRALLGFARRGKNLAVRLSLNDVVRNVFELVRRTVERRIDLVLELEAGHDTVLGDFSQLEQVVMNLVVNARDAMTGTGRLTLRTFDAEAGAEGGRRVALEVSDTGIGIDPALRDRIFEPYFTTKTSGAVRGTGLGLATVYGIVEVHGGTVSVVDNAPVGTTFRVLLPVADVRAPDRTISPDRQAPVIRGSGRILVAEDEPFVRDALEEALRQLGYEVTLAADGVEAVEHFRSGHRELVAVLLDMVMPRMGGGEAYQQMRAIDPSVPVVLSTAYATNEEAQRALDLGARGFVPKPYDIGVLSRELARVTGHARNGAP